MQRADVTLHNQVGAVTIVGVYKTEQLYESLVG
jgi:hypothetical protein